MSYGVEKLYELLNDPTITTLLDTYTDGASNTLPAIFYDEVIPSNVPDSVQKTINFYRASPIDGGLEYLDIGYTVNCRGAIKLDAENIQKAVFDIVNRYNKDTYFLKASILPNISPANDRDNYNAPLEVQIKTK